MKTIALIAVAGALGALARWGLSGVVQRGAGDAFPWGTFAVNVVGCFLFGLVWTAATERDLFSPAARTILLTGFLGAFTTFSTFAFETDRLLIEGRPVAALANVAGHVVLGLVAVGVGFWAGRGV